jgi:alpha-1,6-mannosyltransferase
VTLSQPTDTQLRPARRVRGLNGWLAPRLLCHLALGTTLLIGVVFSLEAAVTKSGVFTLASIRGNSPLWIRGPLALAGHALIPDRFAGLTLVRYLILMCVWGLCYLAVLYLADFVRPRWLFGSIVCLHAVCFLGPFLFSPDLFSYIAQAHLGLHGFNPYRWGPGTAPLDPAVSFSTQTVPLQPMGALTDVYGPLFTAATYPIGIGPLPASAWALKALAVATSIGSVLAVWLAAKRLDYNPARAAAFVGLNPVLLVWTISGAHNDTWVMLFVALGLYLATARHFRLGPASWVAAVGIKATAGLLMPFMLVGLPHKRKALIGTLSAAALLCAGSFAIFQSQIFNLPHALMSVSQTWPDLGVYSVPRLLTSLIHSTPFHTTSVGPTARHAAGVMLLATVGLLCLYAWRSKNWITAAGWSMLAFLFASSWVFPWYLVPLLPLAALSRGVALRLVTLVVAAAMLVFSFPINSLL